MTRYGYAQVSTHEHPPENQGDALASAGVLPENIVIEEITGKLASRPKLDQLLGKLDPGDQIIVTRLRSIGRSHRHLLDLSRWFQEHEVDFVVLEQGIDTSIPATGGLFFRIMTALDEFDREAIVAGTLDGLTAARTRGRVGGRRPKLTEPQLQQAQSMYDAGTHTMDELADTFSVSRTTLYRQLHAYKDGGPCALVVYRNTATNKVDSDNRRFGETGASEKVQRAADSKWFPVAPSRRSRLKAIVYVADGIVARVRGVDPSGTWRDDERGYADIPVTAPLTDQQIAEQLPTLRLRLGDPRPHVRGKIREYLPL